MTESADMPAACRGALPGAKRKLSRAWLQLVRAPNLLTVPGDPMAGACLAGALGTTGSVQRVLVAIVSSLAVYAAGLVDNDLVDLAEDRSARPERPLASGAITEKQARRGRVLLFTVPFLMAGVFRMPFAWLTVQALLVLACLSYNRLKRRFSSLGALLMGGCRGLNMLSGVVLAPNVCGMVYWPLAVVLSWWGYVTGISLFAARETTRVPGACRYLLVVPPLALVVASALPGIPYRVGWGLGGAGICGVILVVDVTVRLRGGHALAKVPPAVGRLVRALVPMQILLCLSMRFVGDAFGAMLLLSWLLSESLSRRFYVS